MLEYTGLARSNDLKLTHSCICTSSDMINGGLRNSESVLYILRRTLCFRQVVHRIEQSRKRQPIPSFAKTQPVYEIILG